MLSSVYTINTLIFKIMIEKDLFLKVMTLRLLVKLYKKSYNNNSILIFHNIAR